MQHELLLELISRPTLEDKQLFYPNWADTFSNEILELRRFLQFNEQEILMRPFIHTTRYLSYKEIEKISEAYFTKYGLHREMYTKKVKAYGLAILSYLFRTQKPSWLIDVARYEYILFSQLWISNPNYEEFFDSQPVLEQYVMCRFCRLGKFSFDIETYMDNLETSEFLFKQPFEKYLVFIGDPSAPYVSVKNIEKNVYSLLKLCRKPRSISEIILFLETNFSFSTEEKTNVYYQLIELLKSWNILELVDCHSKGQS